MNRIAVLITCYNRKEKTLLCLKQLFGALTQVPEVELSVYLVDAASPDGTGDAVRNAFPQVTVINGDDSLFWNRGMRLAWEYAAASAEYDFYLWLNDDTMVLDNALQTILKDEKNAGGKAIICGAVSSSDGNKVTYSGYCLPGGKPIMPDGTIQECDIMNGNVVLIPNLIFKRIGNLDPVFPHGIGDYDYARRAIKAGFKVFVSSQYVGTCERDHDIPKFRRKSIPFAMRIKNLYSPRGLPPGPFFMYIYRHSGLIPAAIQILKLHIRVLFPDYE